LAGAASLQVGIDQRIAPLRNAPEELWISSGRPVEALSLGHNGLLADIYWTRAVQYYGSRLRDKKTDFSLLFPLLDITVTLDPQLTIAYYFGSFFLSAKPPRGAGEPEKAIELLRRGILANPEEWRLWHHLGFLYYWELHDYGKAAEAYTEGAKNPQAAPFVKVMAAAIREKGGDRETSRFLWSEIYNSTEDETIRANALRHLQGLQAQADIGELEKRTRLYHDRTGRWPNSFQELIDAGLLPGIPLDPQGQDYVLQPEGNVMLRPGSPFILESGPTSAPGL
jgi:tetratricopeptide (TPR) repeat protein